MNELPILNTFTTFSTLHLTQGQAYLNRLHMIKKPSTLLLIRFVRISENSGYKTCQIVKLFFFCFVLLRRMGVQKTFTEDLCSKHPP